MVEGSTSAPRRERQPINDADDIQSANDLGELGQSGADATHSDDAGAKRLARIRERAYAIWMNEGQCHGRDEAHWQEAERELDGQ